MTSDLLTKVSASRLNCFHQCRLKFFFRYVQKLKKDKTPALHVGTTVHAVLQFWNKARWRHEPATPERLREVFAQHWVEGQVEQPVQWDGDEAKEMESAWKLLTTYLEQTPVDLDEKPEAVEVPVETQLGSITLVGIIDLIRAGGRIVDYKTAGQTPGDRTAHLHETQLSCYGVLYRAATGRHESGFELHHMVKLKTPKIIITSAPPITAQQEQRLHKTIDSFIAGVRALDWVPSPSPMSCACCEYFGECRRWS